MEDDVNGLVRSSGLSGANAQQHGASSNDRQDEEAGEVEQADRERELGRPWWTGMGRCNGPDLDHAGAMPPRNGLRTGRPGHGGS